MCCGQDQVVSLPVFQIRFISWGTAILFAPLLRFSSLISSPWRCYEGSGCEEDDEISGERRQGPVIFLCLLGFIIGDCGEGCSVAASSHNHP